MTRLKNSPQAQTMLRASCLLLFLLGAVDWLVVPVPGTARHLAFMLSEVFAAVAALFLLVRAHRERKTGCKLLPTVNERALFVVAVLFAAYVLLSVPVRMLTRGFDADFLSYPRVSFVFLVAFLLLYEPIFGIKEKKAVIYIGFTLFNVSELVYFLIHHDLRQSTIAVNVNIFACAAILVIPFLLKTLATDESRLFRVLAGVNLALSAMLIAFSGSRLGFYLMVLGLLCSLVFLRKELHGRKLLRLATPLLCAMLAIVLFSLPASFAYARSAALRSSMTDRLLKVENDDLRYEQTDEETDSDASQKLVRGSDTVRGDMWSDAVEHIRQHLLFGTGNLTFDATVAGLQVKQSPHNMFFEMLVCYGLVGTLLYLAVLACMLLLVLKKQEKGGRCFTLLYSALFGAFSCFQPTFVSYLLLIWFLLLVTTDIGFATHTDITEKRI